jgi:hypothetical protein
VVGAAGVGLDLSGLVARIGAGAGPAGKSDCRYRKRHLQRLRCRPAPRMDHVDCQQRSATTPGEHRADREGDRERSQGSLPHRSCQGIEGHAGLATSVDSVAYRARGSLDPVDELRRNVRSCGRANKSKGRRD